MKMWEKIFNKSAVMGATVTVAEIVGIIVLLAILGYGASRSEQADGTKEWWLNGERHRTDGPAVVYASGTKVWYLNGEEMGAFEFQVNTL